MTNGMRLKTLALILAASLFVGACAQNRTTPNGAPGATGSTAAPKRIAAAVLIDIQTLAPGGHGSVPGFDNVDGLVNVGLYAVDTRGVKIPRMAEQLPTVENGLWKVFPDGRMETTWKLRSDVLWQDGTPFTADDMVFTAALERDPRLPIGREIAYKSVDRVEAPDARTLTVFWKAPYIDADTLFGAPRPKHLLAQPLATLDADRFLALPYWMQDFVGTGPYRIETWNAGSQLVLHAYDRFFLGRPKIDLIELKQILDPSIVSANLLAGAVDMTLGRTLSFEQANGIRSQWAGRIDYANPPVLRVTPQLIDLYTNPPVVGNVQFRRALSHTLDRKAMVDALFAPGMPLAAESLLGPNDPPEYRALENRVVHYPYDLRKASQLVEEIGYTKGGDGFFRDAADKKLSVELRTNTSDVNQKATFSVADFWQRAGVAVEVNVVPGQLAQAKEYRATYPGFEILRAGDIYGVTDFHSSRKKTKENDWTGSYTGYSNPAYDALADRYITTIPVPQRAQIVGDMVNILTDQVVIMTLFWDVEPSFIPANMKNVTGRFGSGAPGVASTVWNAHEWDLP